MGEASRGATKASPTGSREHPRAVSIAEPKPVAATPATARLDNLTSARIGGGARPPPDPFGNQATLRAHRSVSRVQMKQREAGAAGPVADLGHDLGNSIPLPSPLADRLGAAFGRTLSDVRIHPNSPAATRRRARALASGRDVAFAPGEYLPDTRAGLHLLIHELAHVVQQATALDGAPQDEESTVGAADAVQLRDLQPGPSSEQTLEREADHAADAILRGASALRLSSAASSEGRNGTRVQHSPAGSTSGTAESPFAAKIAQDTASAAPSSTATKITIDIPGFGDNPRSQETFVLDEPATGASMVTIYSVPLSALYASPEDAMAARGKPEKERHALSLAASPNAKLATAKASPTGATPPPAGAAGSVKQPIATAADITGTQPTAGVVSNAGPSPTSDVEFAYDLNGTKLGIIERGAEWGLTTEYTKLAVGAAACGVVKTKQGIKLIDAGVRHDGATVDESMKKHAVERLKELVGDEPIRDIIVTHAHLDHIALFEEISKQFIIERITINALQLIDPRFAARAKDIAANQREVLRQKLKKEFEAQRDSWMADNAAQSAKTAEATSTERTASTFPEPGARERQFGEWVEQQVSIELAKAKPIEVHVALPLDGKLNAADIKIGGIEIKPEPAMRTGPGEGYVASEPFVTTVLDPNFEAKLEEFQQELAKNPNAEFKGLDAMSSNYLMTLPNGNQLIVVPDIRTADFRRVQATLVKEFAKLGATVDFRVWDMTHHAQGGWISGGDKAGTAAKGTSVPVAEGAMRASELARMTKLLAKLTATKSGQARGVADAVVVSVDLGEVDPALLYLLESCGLKPVLAHGEQDVQFGEAVTAANRKVGGLTAGEPFSDTQVDPVLRRADVALEDLQRRLEDATSGAELEKAEQKLEAKERQAEQASQREALAREIKRLRAARKTATKNEDETRLNDVQRDLNAKTTAREALNQEVEDIKTRVGPQQAELARINDQIGKIQGAKKAFIQKVRSTPQKTGPGGKPVLDLPPDKPTPFAQEEKALNDLVGPAYHEAIKAGVLPRLTETSLILLGKDVATTPEAAKLVETWNQAELLRARIAAKDLPLHAHAELIEKLTELKKLIAARKDIAGQAAVEDELTFIDKQIETSNDVLVKAAEHGEKSTARDPTTGMAVETSAVAETTTAAAQEGEAGPAATGTEKPEGGEAAKTGDTAGAKAAAAPSKLQKGAAVFGQAMGGVMLLQNISGAEGLLKRYGQDEANAAETAVGFTKSALGMRIGYRMLRGAHVGMGEFVILSVLDIGQTALSNYESSEEFKTEVAYAIARNGVNLALSMVGMALIETANPVGIVAGLAIMFLGDSLLEWLGVHDWLAKKFAFMPDELIEIQTDLDKLIKDYNAIIGAIELAALQDETLKAFGANNPAALRAAIARAVAAHRPELSDAERQILAEFASTYASTKSGYAGFKELDDLRFKFLSLYNKVHEGDPDVDKDVEYEFAEDYGEVGPLGAVKRSEVAETFKRVEEELAPDTIPAEEVPKMEQWTRMDEEITKLVGELYHTDYDDISWMKVSEYEHNLDLMISNARYRLEPQLQGKNRATAQFSPNTPARAAYEAALQEREGKLDVLRARQLDLAMRSSASTGVKEERRVEVNDEGDLTIVPAVLYEPEWGDTSTAPDVEKQLSLVEKLVLYYLNEIWEMDGLPDDLTVVEISRDAEKLDVYRKAAVNDDDYSAKLFALRGSRSSTMAGIERLHRVTGGKTLTKVQTERLKKIDADWKFAEEERIVEYGYLMLDEIAPLKSRIVNAKAVALASALGEAEDTQQLTEEQRAAQKLDELSKFKLSTVRDRVLELGLKLPEKEDQPIERVFRLRDAPNVVVAVTADVTEYAVETEFGNYGDDTGEQSFEVMPLNASAIAYYGNRERHTETKSQLVPMTPADLKGSNK
jgi:Domain of unknown function (DUF4157)/Metallo-beta-lactamase superfamily